MYVALSLHLGKRVSAMHETQSMYSDNRIADYCRELIDWGKVMIQIHKDRAELIDAYRNSFHNNIACIQKRITRSFEAKALAVKMTVGSKGSGTPGIDRICWNTNQKKFQAISDNDPDNYAASPYLRVNIPKAAGGTRPLNIPTLADRAMQSLYRIVLEPISEYRADETSYGFRTGRCTHDALDKCKEELENGAIWILEGDIKRCFDSLSHEWLLSNIPMEQEILYKMLKSGSVNLNKTEILITNSDIGASQGGPISPILCNMALDGMREIVKKSDKTAELIRYADDFIITSKKITTLHDVLPELEAFLLERGLEMSEEKTIITSAYTGFDFLGCTITKTADGIRVEPQEKSIRRAKKKIRTEIESCRSAPVGFLTKRLDLIIRGWSNYYKFYDSTEAFTRIDQTARGLLQSYHMNAAIEENRYKALNTPRVRYIPVMPNKNPFEKRHQNYFKKRQRRMAVSRPGWSFFY